MDPFNMPSFGGAANDAANLQTAINVTAPLATQYHGPLVGGGITQYIAPTTAPKGGVLSQFIHFVGGTLSEIGHVANNAGNWLVENGVNAGMSAVRYGQGLSHGLLDNNDLAGINARNTQLSGELDTLNSQFKAGMMTGKEYSEATKSLAQDMANVDSEAKAVNNRVGIDQQDSYKATVDTASLLVSLLGAGFGKGTAVIGADGVESYSAQTAANYLKSKAANVLFGGSETFMAHAAGDANLFAKLPEVAQTAIQRSVAEVAAAGGSMTSGQIARASVVNLAIKYPIYFNMISGQADQIYSELDQKKYGDATRTAAFNAALLLSGGPIGYALNGIKKFAGVVTDATFDKTGFWDNLSMFYKGGDGKTASSGFADAAQKISEMDRNPITGHFWGEDGKKEFFQNISDAAATNVHAVGGDEMAAAQRVAEGQKNAYNWDLSERNPYDELLAMAKHSQVQGEMTAYAEARGMPAMTAGRIDARSLKGLGELISQGATKTDRHNAFDLAVAQNPGWSWAHNDSFIQQVHKMIDDKDSSEIADGITHIRAGFTPKGIQEDVAKSWAKRGYAPIIAHNLEDPFVEGTGKFASKFVQGQDVFTKMTTPLPVLGHIGDMLTKAGLSPNASVQRTYQLYNANLARNLLELAKSPLDRDVEADSKLSPEAYAAKHGTSIAGAKLELRDIQNSTFAEAQQKVDSWNKDLSSYARDPTRGKIVSKMPITDLRMLTRRDIMIALKVTSSEAADIQKAISLAHMEVPVAVRGLGDMLVDRVYGFTGTGAVARRYLRLQGALRYSWNPFYQDLRVIPKTEYLTSSKGGGILKAMWQGRYGQINDLRKTLREGGFFEEKGGLGNVTQGEAVDAASLTPRNLGRRLLPMQERSIAGLVDDQAQRMGMDTKEYIANYPDQVRDTIQAIAEYDKHANFLNSPMARTLNIAFFPFRFEAKVAAATAKGLARTSLLTQVSVIHGIMNLHQWLSSDEGAAWYSHNADAIGIFKYISPLASFNEVFESLLPGHDHSLGNFGEVGGLPFGFIPAILDAEGLTHFNQPGVNAATGVAFPNYVPETAKGQAAIAIQDFISSVFSYPGATVGLPSKAGFARNIALGVTGAQKGKDIKLQTPGNLSSQAQDYQETIANLNNTNPLQPAPQTNLPATQVPATSTPLLTPPSRKGSLTNSPRKKKADFVPALLPGQTTLGQL